MSLALEFGTKPHGLNIQTHTAKPNIVQIGEYELSIEDFLLAAFYVLTNTNLTHDDQRLEFVKSIHAMRIVEQHIGNHRLTSDTLPIRRRAL